MDGYQDPSRIENMLTEGEAYDGPYLSRIERILKDMKPSGAAFDGPYDSIEDLPNPGETGKIYLVATEDQTDYYDEYYWDEDHETYQPLGTTKIELSDYAKKTDLEAYVTAAALATTLEDYVTASALAATLSDYVTAASLATTLGDYVTAATLATTLADYVTGSGLATILAGYVTTAGLATALEDYVTTASLASTLSSYATKSEVSELVTETTAADAQDDFDDIFGGEYTPPSDTQNASSTNINSTDVIYD